MTPAAAEPAGPTDGALASLLAGVAREMAERDLAWGSSGNLSARVDAGRMLLSGSGVGIGRLTPGDFLEVSFEGPVPAGSSRLRPSKEAPLHAAVYRARSDAHWVLHASPCHATLCAVAGELPPSNLFIESVYFLERCAWVDYHPPGSVVLGEAVGRAALAAEVILLRHHGVVIHADTPRDALMRLETLELACRMWLLARAAGLPLPPLAAAQAAELLRSGAYRPRRPWHVA